MSSCCQRKFVTTRNCIQWDDDWLQLNRLFFICIYIYIYMDLGIFLFPDILNWSTDVSVARRSGYKNNWCQKRLCKPLYVQYILYDGVVTLTICYRVMRSNVWWTESWLYNKIHSYNIYFEIIYIYMMVVCYMHINCFKKYPETEYSGTLVIKIYKNSFFF